MKINMPLNKRNQTNDICKNLVLILFILEYNIFLSMTPKSLLLIETKQAHVTYEASYFPSMGCKAEKLTMYSA